MPLNKRMKRVKGFFLFVSILLAGSVGCARQNNWSYREVISHSPQFDSFQLQHLPEKDLSGIGVELLKGSFGTYCYLTVNCCQIPPFRQDPTSALLVLQINEQTYPYKTERMEGGQKVKLPDEATQKLLEALGEGNAVTVYLEGFMEEIQPRNFFKFSKKFIADSADIK